MATPAVSVIMPVLNEERHLHGAVTRILAQDYKGDLEVVLALGPSTDRTDEVAAELESTDPRVVTVPNPTGKTPAALNAAIKSSSSPIVVRVDGHSLLPDDYISVAVETLERTGADVVGGIMAAEGETDFERAVAAAMTSPLGVGASAFHVGGQEGPAETVYLGVFQRSALERVGGYDETYVRAQDWEMNYRIRTSGGLIWFNPALKVTYRPRSSTKALAKQYFEYGRWRREVMRSHPDTVSGASAARYLAPPAAVAGVVLGSSAWVLSALGPDSVSWLRLGALAPLGYAGIVAAGTVMAGKGLPTRARMKLPGVLATMHGSWGTGFITSPRNVRG